MDRVAKRLGPYAYALLRIVAGLTFAMHGSQKLLRYPQAGPGEHLPTLMVIAGIIELAGGVLILTGFFSRIPALLASGEMAVAYFAAHFPRGFWPIVNRGELAVVYCFVFLYVAAQGSGTWSLDALLRRTGSKAGAAAA